jgi:hypothetical protein
MLTKKSMPLFACEERARIACAGSAADSPAAQAFPVRELDFACVSRALRLLRGVFARSGSGKKTHHIPLEIVAHVIEGPCSGLKHAFEFHSVV